MPRIVDNIEKSLLPALIETLAGTLPEEENERRPRFEALSGSLTLYVESLEMAFPVIVERHKTQQYIEHAANTGEYAIEELEYQERELSKALFGPVARAMRGSALVVFYAAFESTVKDYAKDIAQDLGCDVFNSRDYDCQFMVAANRYFSEVLRTELFGHSREQTQLNLLRLLRNSFVHRQSEVNGMPAKIRELVRHPKSLLVHGEILEGQGIWVPSIGCIKAHADVVRNWARALGMRGIERTGLTAL